MKTEWYKNAVVYQIYPFSFMDADNDGWGDIKGIISKLDYIKDLGVTAIWFSPLYSSPDYDFGYDISDYRAIAQKFGTMEDFDLLLKECHKRDLKVIMDMVINHTSIEHPWFKQALESPDSPYRDYYIWRKKKNNWSGFFGEGAWEYDSTTNSYYLHLFGKKQPDVNWENPKVREEVHNMMNFWLEKGIGGFRMDVIDLIGKEVDNKITGNGPQLHPFLQDMNRESFGKYDVLTVGETWGATPSSPYAS